MSDPTETTEARSGAEWREQREEKHAMRGNWPGVSLLGFAIVLVGLIFLGRNFGIDLPLPDRWWAIVILLPAAGSLVTAARFFRIDHGFSSRATGAAIAGVLMLATALILFLDLDWGKAWPVLVIIVGLGIVARGYRRRG